VSQRSLERELSASLGRRITPKTRGVALPSIMRA